MVNRYDVGDVDNPGVPMCGPPRKAVPVPPMEDKTVRQEAEQRPLPCIVCGAQPEPAFRVEGGTYQPYGATMFSAGAGHYGSTVWDMMSRYRSLMLNVCDECLVKNKSRVAVDVTGPPQPAPIKYEPWDIEGGRD